MAYSFSRLNTYTMCPKRFKYRYVDGLEDNAGEAAALGSLVHEALEHDDVSQVIHDATAYQMYQTGKKIMDGLTIEAKEKRLAIDARGNPTDYNADNALFRGVIDVLGDDYILDWKTGFKTPDPIQLGTYQMLAEAHGYIVLEVKYAMLRYDKFETLPASPELFNQSRQWIVDTINTIEADNSYERNIGKHCEYCPYVSECRQDLDGSPTAMVKELKLLESQVKQIKKDLKQYVQETGKEIVTDAGVYGDKSKVTRKCLNKKDLIQQLHQDGLLDAYAEVKSSQYDSLLSDHPEYQDYFKEQIRNSIGFKEFKMAAN